MKEYMFNKNDYKDYKDFYKDIAIKMDAIKIDDYYDSSTFEYDPNILWEFLSCEFGYTKKCIKIILKNFYIEDMKPNKKIDDYQNFYIIKTIRRFVEYFPNSKLEFIDDN